MSPAAREFVNWMRRLGWNQSETARQLLVTPSHINQIARGKAEPSAAMLQLMRLTAARQAGPAAAEGAPGEAAPDDLEVFWRELRRQRLNGYSTDERRRFAEAWAAVLGISWKPPRARAAKAGGRK